MAKACRCSIQFVSNIEHGRAPLPWDKVPSVASALGLPVDKVQAANLAVRSDFREFATPIGTSGKVLKAGIRRRETSTSVIALAAIAARDSRFQSVLKAYEAASLKNRKRFVRAALELLG